MPPSASSRFSDSVSRFPDLTLAAYLGDSGATAQAAADHIAVPRFADFRHDPVFDPNPHRLSLPEDYLATMFLVRTLAFWGARPLVDLVVVCSTIQLEMKPSAHGALHDARTRAADCARAFQAEPCAERRAAARAAAAACAALYAPFEDDPDSREADETWYGLGASWFAVETAAEDFALTQWDGPGPVSASATWGNRNSVWPTRAADAAAHVSSHKIVRDRIAQDLLARSRRALAPCS